MQEIWKDVAGYEGLYKVSDQGRVKSLNYMHTGQERVLRLAPNTNGYLQVNLYKDGKRKPHRAHRLVAETFIPNPGNKPYLDHINTIKTDNRVDNLRWVTHKENCNNPLTKEHYRISKIGKQRKGTQRKGTQYTTSNKKVFCENIVYDSITQCAEHYNVGRATMNNWLIGKRTMPADFQAKGLKYYIEE